jgi:glycosyltransferase involved in cell wall biosynthesis
MRVIFILPGRGGGGGSHSVVQESLGLKRLGVDVAVATTASTYGVFRLNYPELDRSLPVPLYRDDAELGMVIAGADLAVATTAPSAIQLAKVLQAMPEPRPRPAYYIQDYEPLFFTPGTEEWSQARASYTALDDALLMAKTDWLRRIVETNHGRPVAKVSPSLDHGVYHPDLRERGEGLTISAMLRPRTPRRAPRRTIRIMERLAATLAPEHKLVTFGCEASELEREGLKLSPRIEHGGVLSRVQVAAVLRGSDLFLDLSDYQAFGRTGLEGMACGCVPVLPVFGGADEYARDRQNAYVVDTRSDEACLAAVRSFVGNGVDTRERLRSAAIETALNYSIERAAFSEHQAFAAYLRARTPVSLATATQSPEPEAEPEAAQPGGEPASEAPPAPAEAQPAAPVTA